MNNLQEINQNSPIQLDETVKGWLDTNSPDDAARDLRKLKRRLTRTKYKDIWITARQYIRSIKDTALAGVEAPQKLTPYQITIRQTWYEFEAKYFEEFPEEDRKTEY